MLRDVDTKEEKDGEGRAIDTDRNMQKCGRDTTKPRKVLRHNNARVASARKGKVIAP